MTTDEVLKLLARLDRRLGTVEDQRARRASRPSTRWTVSNGSATTSTASAGT